MLTDASCPLACLFACLQEDSGGSMAGSEIAQQAAEEGRALLPQEESARLPLQQLQQQQAQQQQQQQSWAPQPLEFDTGLRAASDADYLAPPDLAPSPVSSFSSPTAPAPAGRLTGSSAAAQATGGLCGLGSGLGSGGSSSGSPSGLPPLRLGRLSAPPASPRVALASVPPSPRTVPQSPRAGGRLFAVAGGDAAAPRSAQMSPRIRTSLLPSAANRQAVAHVGELMSGEGDDPAPSSPSSTASGSAASPAAPTSVSAAALGPFAMQWQASSRGQSRLLHSSATDGSRASGSAGGSGGFGTGGLGSGGGGGGFGTGRLGSGGGGGFHGLASVLKPLSPGKISPLASAANSPEPKEVLKEEAEEGAELAPGAAELASAALPHQQQAAQPPMPLLDQPEAAAVPAIATSCGEAAGTPATAARAEEEEAGSWDVPPADYLPAAAAAAAPGWPLPGRSVSLDMPGSEALPPSPFTQQQQQQPAQQPHHCRLSAAVLPLATAASASSRGSVKPWQAGTLLLRRSTSTPLIGIAEQLEQQAEAAATTPKAASDAGSGAGEGGLAAGLGSAASGGSSQLSEEVVAEARIRLVAGECARCAGGVGRRDCPLLNHSTWRSSGAVKFSLSPGTLLPLSGLKRYFHAKRGEGLLSAQAGAWDGVGGEVPWPAVQVGAWAEGGGWGEDKSGRKPTPRTHPTHSSAGPAHS